MSNSISSIGGAVTGGFTTPVRLGDAVGPVSGESFAAALTEAVQRVESYRQGAEQAAGRFLAGEGEDVHRVALAAQEAELSLEMFLQVKNKLVQAYQEIMRLQV